MTRTEAILELALFAQLLLDLAMIKVQVRIWVRERRRRRVQRGP